jgi:hypothetical protein
MAYSGPVDDMSTFCVAGMDGGHCLRVGAGTCGETWAINCEGGATTFTLCTGDTDRCTTSVGFPSRCQ